MHGSLPEVTPHAPSHSASGNPAPRPPQPPGRASLLEPPGGILVWMLVVLELVTFGIGLIVFVVMRNADATVFRQSQELLNVQIATANTLILLTGGWFMVSALDRLREGAGKAASRWVAAAATTGMAFLALKGWEYTDKLHHGLDLHHNTFFTLYWLLTGFHFLHVVVALLLLAIMARRIRRGRYTAGNHEDVESSAVFWHLCDLIWLLLFPVIYLLP